MPDTDRRPTGEPRPCPEFVYVDDDSLRAEMLRIRTEHDPEHQDDNPYERCALCHFTRHPCDTFDAADQAIALLDRIAELSPDPDEPHIIEFATDGWIIQHPLRERMAGHLFHCTQRWDGPPPTSGRFILNEDGTIGDPVDPD